MQMITAPPSQRRASPGSRYSHPVPGLVRADTCAAAGETEKPERRVRAWARWGNGSREQSRETEATFAAEGYLSPEADLELGTYPPQFAVVQFHSRCRFPGRWVGCGS